jgi:hypothetical protein
MNTVEYINHWAKLHDVSFDVRPSNIEPYVNVTFNGSKVTLSSRDDKEYMQQHLYDLVYGVRGDVCPDTVRPEEDPF